MRKTAVLTCVAFFVGLGLGFAVGRRERGLQGLPKPAPAETVATAVAKPVEPASSPAKGEPAAPATRATATHERLVAEALAAIPAPPVETGAGKITGSVQTESGEPAPGVEIRAYRVKSDKRSRGRGPHAAPADTIEAQVVEMVTNERWRQSHQRVARTDASGRYALTDLAASPYRLEAALVGYEIETIPEERYPQVEPGGTLDFVVHAVVELRVAVVSLDGSSPEEANIQVRTDSGRSRSTRSWPWSPGQPSLRLRPGRYLLSAVSGANEEYRSDPQEVTLSAGVDAVPLTFQLRGNPGIRGRLILPEGETMKSAQVYALRFAGAMPPTREVLKESNMSDWVTPGGEGLKYAFREIAPGTYLLGASRGDGKVAVTTTVDVSDHMVDMDLVLPPLDPADHVVVRVYGPAGELLSDVDFGAGYRSGGSSWSGGASEVRQKDGSYWVPYYDRARGEDSSGRYFLTVNSEQYGRREVEYRRGEIRDLDVRFGDPGTVEIQVAGYVGSGYEGRLSLSLARVKTDGRRRSEDEHLSPKETDAEGRVSLGPIEPGTYEVVLSLGTERHESVPVARVPVTVRPGKNQATVRLPALHNLTVVVEGAAPEARLQIHPVGEELAWWGNPKEIGKDGRVTFESLPAGSYTLTLWGGAEPGMMTVTVPAPPLVRLEPQPVNAFQVTVNDPAGAFAAAGLQTGDLIVGVNGTEFQSVLQMQTLIVTLVAQDQATFHVQRGTAKLEITLDPKKLLTGDGAGGSLEPTSR